MTATTVQGGMALCHEWVTTYGGSEIVAGRLAAAVQINDVFTFSADPDLAARIFPGCNVRIVRPLGSSEARRWRWLLPIMAAAWRRVDLAAYGVVVTSSHACVNAIRVSPGSLHISYCHTPMRYAWEWRTELGRVPAPLRPAWPLVAAFLRRQDRRRASNVTHFIANSNYVAARIRRSYGRLAAVIYPPVDTEFWTPGAEDEKEDFYLLAGRLVAYKRSEVALEAANRSSLPLVVAGDGPELPRLKRIAGPTVEFVEQPSNEVLRELYRRAKALVFPGVEDFGMTMVEAQACGTPVIAFARGGALEAVADHETGILYREPTIDGLAAAMTSFDPGAYSVEMMRRHVQKFDAARFDVEIRAHIDGLIRSSRGPFAADDLDDGAEEDLDV